MKKNILLILTIFVAGIWIIQRPELSHPGSLAQETPRKFIDFTGEIFLLIGVTLLACLAFRPQKNLGEVKGYPFRVWLFGVLSILGITTISVIIFNPTDIFDWNVNNISERQFRLAKPYLYDRLESTPDIIFLGSSVSFQIPAQKYARKFSLSGFNFSVQGGTIVDYFSLSNLIVSRSTNISKPAVIIIEVLSPGLSPTFDGIPFYRLYPVEYAQYMPANFAFEVISRYVNSIFAASSVSNVIFAKFWNQQQLDTDYASSDGRETFQPTSESPYKQNFAEDGLILDKQLWCKRLDPTGQELLQKIVGLSQKRHMSIIFYRPPINKDFYTIMKKDRADYQPCASKLGHLMKQIQKVNQNVFYVDLSNYLPISSGGRAMFIDSHHLTTAGTDHLLEALTPTVQEAIAYARSR